MKSGGTNHIRTYQNRDIETNPERKKECIKFIYLCDIYKYKKHRYEYNGNFYSRNRYGVAILTENNYYYYNEVMVSPKRITQTTLLRLKNFFTARFKFTEKTKVCISDTLTNRNEPIVQFMTIAATACGFTLKWTNRDHMLKILSHQYPRVNIGEYSRWKRKRILDMLMERGLFVFIPDDNWYENLEFKNERTRISYLDCAIGIIYMDCLRNDYEKYRRHMKKVEMGEITRKYRTKEEIAEDNERKRLEAEEKLRIKTEMEREEKRNPTVFRKKDKVLGEIEMVNLFKWCLT